MLDGAIVSKDLGYRMMHGGMDEMVWVAPSVGEKCYILAAKRWG